MNQHHHTTAHLQFRVPAVRHLAWMCHAPQLIGFPLGFDPAPYLPDTLEERLRAWDRAPQNGPAVLTETPARRLGQYFERLYECLLEDLLGWQVLLKNQPVRSRGITLGELDFIVRNPIEQVVEHHEIAVKFYLGYRSPDQTMPLWYGPNSRDRLDLKSERLVSHQSRLTEKPETRELLHSLGIPVPEKTRIFMPGYLFYPAGQTMPLPAGVPPDHLGGEWLYIDDLDRAISEGSMAEALHGRWIPLIKPHWLGPWCQEDPPQSGTTEDALETVRSAGTPRLFAVLRQSPEDRLWREHTRVFVVPGNWPTH